MLFSTANRLDGGKRRYITVEQGDYFNTIIKPRMQKVAYSADWKLGNPPPPKPASAMPLRCSRLRVMKTL